MVKDDAGRHGFTMTIETPKPNPDLAFIHSWSDLINSRDALFKKNPVCKADTAFSSIMNPLFHFR